MPDITLPADYIVNENHGTNLMLSVKLQDMKAEFARAVFEMHDGAKFLGPKVTFEADANELRCKKLNGDVEILTDKNFNSPVVKNLFKTAAPFAALAALFPDLTQGS